MPKRLARLHRSNPIGSILNLRRPTTYSEQRWRDVVVGAGFDQSGTRLWSLPDSVSSRMGLLVCGLNPSPASADSGVGFARPGNRFWPAMLAAGLVERDRDPAHALDHHGIGMTDIVKRTTRTAAELRREEYESGLARIGRLVDWLDVGAICFVGLAGWRAAVDRRAVAGRQPTGVGGTPVYLMPSTSGLNASAQLPDLTEHLRAAVTIASRS